VPRLRVAALALTLGVLARAAAAQSPEAPVQLTDVTVQSQGEAVAVSIVTSATSAALKCRSQLIAGPFRLVLDCDHALYRGPSAPIAVDADPVKEIRGRQYRNGVARLVIVLARKVPYTLESHAGGLRVVFAPANTAAPAPASASPPPVAPPPAPPPAPAAPPKPPPPPTASATWRLQGIVLLDEKAVAFITDPTTNKVGRYVVGDMIGDGVVEVIEERHVVLTTLRGRIELRLEEPRSAPRPRP
jgi:hypothetical protein